VHTLSQRVYDAGGVYPAESDSRRLPVLATWDIMTMSDQNKSLTDRAARYNLSFTEDGKTAGSHFPGPVGSRTDSFTYAYLDGIHRYQKARHTCSNDECYFVAGAEPAADQPAGPLRLLATVRQELTGTDSLAIWDNYAIGCGEGTAVTGIFHPDPRHKPGWVVVTSNAFRGVNTDSVLATGSHVLEVQSCHADGRTIRRKFNAAGQLLLLEIHYPDKSGMTREEYVYAPDGGYVKTVSTYDHKVHYRGEFPSLILNRYTFGADGRKLEWMESRGNRPENSTTVYGTRYEYADDKSRIRASSLSYGKTLDRYQEWRFNDKGDCIRYAEQTGFLNGHRRDSTVMLLDVRTTDAHGNWTEAALMNGKKTYNVLRRRYGYYPG